MTSLSHSRAFLSILLVVLQFAFLPRVGGCGRDGSVTGGCCCTAPAGDDVAGEGCCGEPPIDRSRDGYGGRSCCSESDAESDPEAPRPDDRDGLCGCATPPSTIAAWTSQGDREQGQNESGRGDLAALPSDASRSPTALARGAHAARILPAATPRPPTGPPLHLRKQVFLI